MENDMHKMTNQIGSVTDIQEMRSLQFPELEQHDYGDSIAFCGTRDALKSAGLIPAGTLFPDECDARRGVRWRSETGRRFTLAKGWGPVGTFRLTVYATPEEKRQMNHAARVAREVEALDKSLQAIDITEHEFRDSARRLLLAFWRGAIRDNGLGQDVWTYSPEVLESMLGHFDEIQSLLSYGAVVRKTGALNVLKARRAALQNEQLQSWIATLRA